MPHSASTYRSLNSYQHQLLQLLYLFRFATAHQITEQQSAKHIRVILNRLKILVDQGYIGMFAFQLVNDSLSIKYFSNSLS